MTRDEALKKMQAVKSYMTSGNPIWSVTEIGEAFDMAIEALEQPERKTGKWEMLNIPMAPPPHKCSVCGMPALCHMTGCLVNRHLEEELTNFCPNCGAKMEGEEDG